jgi:D-serine deaminase-like pyridoxal phosphate-dependent protein
MYQGGPKAQDAAVLGPEFKSFPPRSWGMRTDEFLATKPQLAEFQTPLLTLDFGALEYNVRLMAQWVAARGLEIAPHGKTTMAPQLWAMLLDAGAWGITVATPWQAQLARAHGVQRIILANEMVDPVALRWLAEELRQSRAQGSACEFVCWVDSVEGVGLMERVLVEVSSTEAVGVVVELGSLGARTGTRSVAEALEVAAAVEAAEHLSLRGVGGYEGSITAERTPAALGEIEHYLDQLLELHEAIAWGERRPIVTAGGSAYFELVGDKLGTLRDRATVVLRSGAYQVHDDGFYLGISPFAAAAPVAVAVAPAATAVALVVAGAAPAVAPAATGSFRSAMHGWARVVSAPEPGLVLLDGGKRDFPADLGFPTAQLVVGFSEAESHAVLAGSAIVKLADQHAFLQLADGQSLPVGAVVRLGLSHPCTAFDKWRMIPVIADSSSAAFADGGAAVGAGSTVTDLIRTYF